MGVADSPLIGRVIFVEGAPRSGTTLLMALLSAHPDVAGITGESRLFERGVGCLFDNHEAGGHLATYVSREELVDLVRDLVDGALMRMRAATRPNAGYVVEKTPVIPESPEIPLRRKLECYPDALYVHIVREREAAVRSLMRASFNQDPSRAASERWWAGAVDAARTVFGEAEHYHELRYEDLAADPRATMARLFASLGLDAGDEVMDRVDVLSRERYAGHGPRHGEEPPEESPPTSPSPAAGRPQTLRQRVGRSPIGRPLRDLVRSRRTRRPLAVADAFARAFRERDAEALAAMCAPAVELVFLGSDGDVHANGSEALQALDGISTVAFTGRFLSESWTVEEGDGVHTYFSGIRHDGSRVDLWWVVLTRRARVTRVGIMSAGPLAGRDAREWSPGGG